METKVNGNVTPMRDTGVRDYAPRLRESFWSYPQNRSLLSPSEVVVNESLQGGVAFDSRANSAVIYLPFVHAADRERDVERINSFALYDVGKAFRAVETLPDDLSASTPAVTAFWAVHGAHIQITQLLGGSPFPLGLSRSKAAEFRDALALILSAHFMQDDGKGGHIIKYPDTTTPPLIAWEFWRIKRALTEFETIFSEEMKEAATYYVPRRGIFWTPALADTADESFPEVLRGDIPEKTKEDWKAAGRCLAFNMLSACGFHSARAVEGILEAYYQLFAGKPGETLNNWHDYFQALEKIAKAKPDPAPSAKTLGELDQMRKDYRNPIMHPRVVLTEPDARMLFANSESLIIAMAQEINTLRDKGGVQLALTTNEAAVEYSNERSGASPNAANAAAAKENKLGIKLQKKE